MRCRGFTLFELLCILLMSAILVLLAVPSWQRPLATAAVRAAAGQALAGLALARRTALASGHAVTLCLTTDFTRCDLSGSEWMLFSNEDAGSLGRREAGETLLRRWPLPRGVRVSGTRAYAWYLPQPRAAATLTLEFCHAAAPESRRSVIVSQTGRPRLSAPDLPSSPALSRCP